MKPIPGHPPVAPRTRPALFLVSALLLTAIAILVQHQVTAGSDLAARREQEQVVVALHRALTLLADRDRSQGWLIGEVHDAVQRALAAAPAEPAAGFPATAARAAAAAVANRLHGATVFAFAGDGRLVWPAAPPARRARELLWRCLLEHLRQEALDAPRQRALADGDRIAGSFFGPSVGVSFLANPADPRPQGFLDHDRPTLSWALPAERLVGPAGRGSGGIWLLLPCARLPRHRLAAHTLAATPAEIDTAMILAPRQLRAALAAPDPAGGPHAAGRVPARPLGALALRGSGRLHRATLRRSIHNRAPQSDGGLAWQGCFLDDGEGRFLLVGTDPARHGDLVSRHAALLLPGFQALLLGALALALRRFAFGMPGTARLGPTIFVSFVAAALLPFALMVGEGLRRAAEARNDDRRAWEDRLQESLRRCDARLLAWARRHEAALHRREVALAERLGQAPPLSGGELRQALGPLTALAEITLVTDRGEELVIGPRSGSPFHQEAMLAVQRHEVATLVANQGRPVPAALRRNPPLVSPEGLAGMLAGDLHDNGRFRSHDIARQRFFTRPVVLADRAGQMRGLLHWLVDPTRFAAPMVQRELARSWQGPGPVRLAALARDGGFHPAGLGRPPDLVALLGPAAETQEQGAFVTVRGTRYLAVTRPPRQLPGYRLVALVDADVVERDVHFLHRLVATSALLGGIFLLFAARFLGHRLLPRLHRLHAFIGELQAGRLGQRLAADGGDELAALARTFNSLAAGLAARERLRALVSEDAWEAAQRAGSAASGIGERRQVSVLFTHVHDFDRLVDRLAPEELLAALNRYFARVQPAVLEHGGRIDKLIGDAMMAVFHPRPGQDVPPRRALRAARALLAASASLARERDDNLDRPWRTDVGVHHGEVVHGPVGARDGRRDVTVIGDTVNTAARLVGVAQGQPRPTLVVGRVVAECDPAAAWRPLPPLPLKGKTAILDLFAWSEPE